MASPEPPRVTPALRAWRAARLRGIYTIVNEGGPDPVALAHAATHAGVAVLQYRAKRGIAAATLHRLRALTHACGALLIVNDDADAAVRFDCDGVHLGPGDAGFDDIARVRRTVGERLVGISCGTLEETLTANADDVDYLGAGSVYPTASKTDAGDPIGIGGLSRIVRASRVPVAAIGGITEVNVAEVAACGAAMAAVISAISNASDPGAAAQRLVGTWAEVAA